jgi:hypothetical protein
MFDPYGLVQPGVLGIPTDGFGKPIGGPVEHPRASSALIAGFLGLGCCGICAPIAWVISRKALNDINRSGGCLSGRVQATVGLVLGIVGTILMVAEALMFAGILIVGHA